MNTSLKGKTVLVTGTARGIGRACVEEFVACGCNVIAHARRESDAFTSWSAELANKFGVVVRPIYFDMADSASMKAELRKLITEKVPLSAIVNNAGVPHGGLFQMTSVDKIKEVFNVNFFAQLELTQFLYRYLVKLGGGSIVNIASVSGINLSPGNCAYGVSKAALMAFTKTFAAECAAQKVRVNAVAPGLIDTDMAKMMDEKAHTEMIDASPMHRLGLPHEVAKVVAFLASDDSSYMTGEIVKVTGGL